MSGLDRHAYLYETEEQADRAYLHLRGGSSYSMKNHRVYRDQDGLHRLFSMERKNELKSLRYDTLFVHPFLKDNKDAMRIASDMLRNSGREPYFEIKDKSRYPKSETQLLIEENNSLKKELNLYKLGMFVFAILCTLNFAINILKIFLL